jgi:hypothetical protein
MHTKMTTEKANANMCGCVKMTYLKTLQTKMLS